jgi:glycerol-3-phosphate acyltransferase PlsY
MTATAILMICIAYLAGSLSSAVIVCSIFILPDPRVTGSKNPGATNVYRIGGRFPAFLVLFFDILKGLLPVYCSYWWGHNPVELGLVAIAACLGHSFPLYFGFKGGKAVATAFGAMLPIGFGIAGALIATWAVTVFITGYSSLGAIVVTLLAPLYTYLAKPEYTVSVTMLCALVLIRHHSNIKRLFQGEESRLFSGKGLSGKWRTSNSAKKS